MRKKMFAPIRKKLYFPLVFLPLLSGCCLFDPLPEGKAPEGAIIHNRVPQRFNTSSAVNYMTTALSIQLLTNPLSENAIAVDADTDTLPHAAAVVEEIARVTGLQKKNLPYHQILKTRFKENRWVFSLIIKDKTIWKEELLLTLMSEKETPSVQAEKGNK